LWKDFNDFAIFLAVFHKTLFCVPRNFKRYFKRMVKINFGGEFDAWASSHHGKKWFCYGSKIRDNFFWLLQQNFWQTFCQ